MKKFKEIEINGNPAVELLEIPYEGIIVSLGKVSFTESYEGGLTMHYDYDVVDDNEIEYDKETFEHYLGDLIREEIEVGIAKNNLVYTGGIDDDRENDFSESGSQ